MNLITLLLLLLIWISGFNLNDCTFAVIMTIIVVLDEICNK